MNRRTKDLIDSVREFNKIQKDLTSKRPGCIVCNDEQTDLVFIHSDLRQPSLGREVHVGFPVCDAHDLTDLAPDQYVIDDLIVEIF